MRVSQKSPDGSASELAIIASKLIHIHSNELTGELRVHVTRVGKRMTHCLVSMRQAIIDAFANNFAEIMADRCRDIFAHHISTKRQWQASLSLPPFAEIEDLLKTRSRIGELSLVHDQTRVSAAAFDCTEHLVYWN